MKKTLIMTLALAATSVAYATTYTIDNRTTNLDNNGQINLSTSFEDYEATLGYAWTLNFTVSNITATESNWPVLFTFGSSETTNFFHLWLNQTKTEVALEGPGLGVTKATAAIDFSTPGASHTFKVVSTGSNKPTLSLYIDDATTASFTTTASFSQDAADNWLMKFLAFGSRGNNNTQNTAATFSNITLEVTAVPEPATATLSLLALAGLAARRRRK